MNNDGGDEYTLKDFDNFYKENGIRHLNTMRYTLQKNGITEGRNSTLMDMTWLMLAHPGLPLVFWGEALSTTTYILNRMIRNSKSLTLFSQ